MKYHGFEDGGTVTISARKSGDMVQFSVSDTGIGIKEENVGKLFRKFEQLDSGYTRKSKGIGLGLAISKLCLRIACK
ncbi:MAG: ATP-binding protein [Candidatus Methanoperedens sp.]